MVESVDREENPGDGDIVSGLKAMGYLPTSLEFGHGLLVRNHESETPQPNQPLDSRASEVDKAVRSLPPRSFVGKYLILLRSDLNCTPYIYSFRELLICPVNAVVDLLVDSFFEDANFHYYIIHTQSFRDDYGRWWANRQARQHLDAAFTCLVLRICACSLQYIDSDAKRSFESEMLQSVQDLKEKYHEAAQDLSRALHPGSGGIANVQQLLLCSFWFKSESKYVDAWHALGNTIHEAQEQGKRFSNFPCGFFNLCIIHLTFIVGMHRRQSTGERSAFEVEMARRLWCLMCVWDW